MEEGAQPVSAAAVTIPATDTRAQVEVGDVGLAIIVAPARRK
jgi:hypothetical protein